MVFRQHPRFLWLAFSEVFLGPRGAGQQPRWVGPWRCGECRPRGRLKRRSQARSPAAAKAEGPEDLNLPNAIITGITREALRDGVNISTSRTASIFVLNAASCANSFAMGGKLKTPNASDVLSAMEKMAFQHFVTLFKEALEAYKKEQKGKEESFRAKEGQRQKKKNKKILKSRTGAEMRTTIKMRKG
ncbi:hypothetical protein FD755_019557 [Muntiacus reevesi]|uniref:Transcription factor CBF/NF-Y/archaeal histone domain-containing protein n=1 Tax=Muntiacus reevesi TaxID=9886 RepID=A0A5N3X330_MUNRE|nr:hypothetical protein FD755_019557 [Muntiacus reevesi]